MPKLNALEGIAEIIVTLLQDRHCAYVALAPTRCKLEAGINVTLTGVTLKTAEDEEGDSFQLSLTAGDDTVVNLLDYQNGEVVLIAAGEVPDGDYAKIRMHVSEAELVRDDDGDPDTPDIVEPIFIPAEKVDVPVSFSLSNGADMEVTLDFDAELSMQVNETSGQPAYILRPVINIANMN